MKIFCSLSVQFLKGICAEISLGTGRTDNCRIYTPCKGRSFTFVGSEGIVVDFVEIYAKAYLPEKHKDRDGPARASCLRSDSDDAEFLGCEKVRNF